MLGARVRDRSGRFRARLGPVAYETLEELMPGGRRHEQLRHVLDQFTRGILEAEVEVVLDEAAAPTFRLGSERGGRLGVSTVLGRLGEGPTRVRFTMTADPTGVRPQFIGPGAADE
jgi:predicted component of type VI protein secretion system